MIRIAVVGMGLMGMLHARILQRLRGVEVVAAIDIDESRLALARQEFGVETGRSIEAVIDRVDAVSVTLPDHLHVDACRLALLRDKFVLVEKPLATTPADCERILAARKRPEQAR